MNTTQVLFAFFVCFVFCYQTLSQPVHQTSAQEWVQQIQKSGSKTYGDFMILILGLASSGRNAFEHPESLTSDCVRTARVIMNLRTKPSTARKTAKMLELSIAKAYNDTTPNQNLAETLCHKLNEVEKLSDYTISNFEELKNQVELPKPEKNYFTEVPQGVNVTQFVKKTLKVEIKDEEILRFLIMFITFSSLEYDTITELAERDAFRSTVDELFTQALNDYVKEISKVQIYTTDDRVFRNFKKEAEKYFEKNTELFKEYQKRLEQKKV